MKIYSFQFKTTNFQADPLPSKGLFYYNNNVAIFLSKNISDLSKR